MLTLLSIGLLIFPMSEGPEVSNNCVKPVAIAMISFFALQNFRPVCPTTYIISNK